MLVVFIMFLSISHASHLHCPLSSHCPVSTSPGLTSPGYYRVARTIFSLDEDEGNTTQSLLLAQNSLLAGLSPGGQPSSQLTVNMLEVHNNMMGGSPGFYLQSTSYHGLDWAGLGRASH